MFFLIYLSNATQAFSTEELVELLNVARTHNAEIGVTGMLLYKDGRFMQILEGQEETVHSLFQEISSDPRHHKVVTLLEGPCEAREFPDWSMGFQNLDSSDLSATPGYSEFLNKPFTEDEFLPDPTRAQRLLRVFKRI